MARYPLTRSRVSSCSGLLLQEKWGCTGKGQLPGSQADRTGYENPGEDCGRPHQTVGVNFLSGFVPGRGTTDAIFVVRQLLKVSSCQQETQHGFRRPGEGV